MLEIRAVTLLENVSIGRNIFIGCTAGEPKVIL